MDGRRFDTWTRLLATGVSRRRTLQAVASVGLAGTATKALVHEAAACVGEDSHCTTRSECCAPLSCVFKTCQTCIALNDRCKNSEECCAGLTCNKHNNCTKGEGGGRAKSKHKNNNKHRA